MTMAWKRSVCRLKEKKKKQTCQGRKLLVEGVARDIYLSLCASAHAQAICSHGNMEGNTPNDMPLGRVNALVQDSLASLRSLQRQYELLAHQLISVEEKDLCLKQCEDWKMQYQKLHLSVRAANLLTKRNIEKARRQERELLLSGSKESTNLRQNLQTQAGLTAAAESTTESLRRSRQMMQQELDRNANTLAILDQSTMTLRKAESEHKGQQTLLMITRGLLAILRRQDIVDRFIVVAGFIVFSLVVTYIFNQRIGIVKMRRNEAAFSVVNSRETTIGISVEVDIIPASKLDTVLPNPISTGQPQNWPGLERAETIKERFEDTVCNENCPSYENQSQAKVHDEL